jgi:hypothetical protein
MSVPLGPVPPGSPHAYRGKAAAIEAEIEQTRQKIEETLNALRAKLSPAEALHRARDVAKRHPLEVAFLVVAVITGVVWHVAVSAPARRGGRR